MLHRHQVKKLTAFHETRRCITIWLQQPHNGPYRETDEFSSCHLLHIYFRYYLILSLSSGLSSGWRLLQDSILYMQVNTKIVHSVYQPSRFLAIVIYIGEATFRNVLHQVRSSKRHIGKRNEECSLFHFLGKEFLWYKDFKILNFYNRVSLFLRGLKHMQ